MIINNDSIVFLIETYRKIIVKYFNLFRIFFMLMNFQIINQLFFVFKANEFIKNSPGSKIFFQLLDIISLKFLLIGDYKYVLMSIVMFLFIITIIIWVYIINCKIKNRNKILNIIYLIIVFSIQLIFNIPLNELLIDFIYNINISNTNFIIEIIVLSLLHILIILQKWVFVYLLTENFFINPRKKYYSFKFNFIIYINVVLYVIPVMDRLFSYNNNIAYTITFLTIFWVYNIFMIFYYFKYNHSFIHYIKKFMFYFIFKTMIFLFFSWFILIFNIKNWLSIFIIIQIIIIILLIYSSILDNKLILIKNKNIWKNIIYKYINSPLNDLFNFRILRFHNNSCININCICNKIIIKLENGDFKNLSNINILKIIDIHLSNLKINLNKKILLNIILFKNNEYFLYRYISWTIKFNIFHTKSTILKKLLKNLLNKFIKKININDYLNNVSFEELTNFHRNYEKFKNLIVEFNDFYNINILNFNIENENIKFLRQNIIIMNNKSRTINNLYKKSFANLNINKVKLIYSNFLLIYFNDRSKGLKLLNEFLKENKKLLLFKNNVWLIYKLSFYIISSIGNDFSINFLEYSESLGYELGYTKEELKKLILNNILLNAISNVHDNYIHLFLKGNKFSKKNIKRVFLITKNKFIKCYKMEYKIIPEINKQLKIVGVFKRINKYNYFVVYDWMSESTFYINKRVYNDFNLILKDNNYYLKNNDTILARNFFNFFKDLTSENALKTYNIKYNLKYISNSSNIEIFAKNIKTINNNDFKIIFIGFNYKITNLETNKKMDVGKLVNISNNIAKLKKNISNKIIELKNDYKINKKDNIFININNLINEIKISFMISILIFILIMIIFLFLIFYFQNNLMNKSKYYYSIKTNSYIYYKSIYNANILLENLNNQSINNSIFKSYNNLNNIFYKNNKIKTKYFDSVGINKSTIVNNLVNVYIYKNKEIIKEKLYYNNNFFNILSKSEILVNSVDWSKNIKDILYIALNYHSNYEITLMKNEDNIRNHILDNLNNIYIINSIFTFNLAFIIAISLVFFIQNYKINNKINNKLIIYFFKFKEKILKKKSILNEKNEILFNLEIKDIRYFDIHWKNISSENNNLLSTNQNGEFSQNWKRINVQSKKNNKRDFYFYIIKIIILWWFITGLNYLYVFINGTFYNFLNFNIKHYDNLSQIRLEVNNFLIYYINSANKYKNLNSLDYDLLMKNSYDKLYNNINNLSKINNISFFLYSNYRNIENNYFNVNSCNNIIDSFLNCVNNDLYNKEAFLIIVLVYENLKKEIGNLNLKIISDNMILINYLDNSLKIIQDQFKILEKNLFNFFLYILVTFFIFYNIFVTSILIYFIYLWNVWKKRIKIFEVYFLKFD